MELPADKMIREAQVLKLQLKDVYSAFGQRPAASAIQLDAKVDKMVVSGTPQKDFVPRMITSHSQTSEKDQVYSLLTVSLETNPLDGKCDTRVKVTARPLEIIYDAQTVNKLASFFKPPESVQLKQFSQAAMAQFEEMKEMSATGMQHAIEQHKYTDISVDLASSYVIVPQGGIMKNDVHMLVLDLGHLSVDSEKHKVEGDVKLESLETKMEKAYDKFNIKLQRIQLLFVHPGEKWQAAREAGHSSMHILAPISILLDLGKCIFDKDPRMAKMKVSGVLPNISVTMSDTRLKEILDLGPSNLPTVDLSTTHMITKQVNIVATELEGGKKPELQRGKSLEQVNFIDMELNFEIREVLLAVNQTDKTTNTETPLLKVLVERIGVDVKMRTFDMLVNAYLGAIYVQHLKYKLSDRITQQLKSVGGGPLINLVNSPTVTDASKHLLAVTFLQANKKGPEFATTYANTEQSIEVTFSALELLLHQGAILSLLEFAQNIAPAPASAATGEVVPVTSHTATKEKPSEHAQPKPVRKRRVKEEDLTIINLKVVAVLHEFSVGICNEEKLITDIQIKGIQANVAMMKQKMEIGALLRDMAVLDPDPSTKYHKIMQIEGSEVLKADVVVYNGGTEGEKYADMKCVDTSVSTEIGCIKIVFVNKFVNDLLAFADNFQAAKDKMAEASQVAAQAGMEAAKSLQETAARLGLHVQMKAPVIIVPQNSASLNTILLDLGQLSVTNAFRLAGKSSASGVPAVLEEMKIVLTSLKLSRAHVQDDGRSVQAECQLLEPVTIALTMQRNLSAAWYHDKPDIDISGALEPLTTRGVCGHDPHRCLGKFELQVVAVGASIKTDTSIAAKVSLQDTILDDLRPSKQAGITRMIERSKGAGAKSRKMILVDFSQDAEQNKNVKLEVSTLYICVCVEFLMTLADFFTKGMPQASSDQPKPAETAVTSASQASVAKEKETPAPAVGSMDVVLAMEKPEIILIEDQMNHKTNALVVDMELSFRMRQNPDVLMPCNIDVVSSAPQGRNPHMDVSISDIVLNITPATIRTITAVSSGMAPPSEEGDQKQRESLPSDLWAIRKLADCGFWFVKLAKDAGVVEPFVPLPVEEATDVGRGEELMLGLPSLVVKLEGGIGHRTIPLLIVEASFQAQVRDWSTKLESF
nr:hypothetical protein BaRGS_017352 [Batillaria attramentaria]